MTKQIAWFDWEQLPASLALGQLGHGASILGKQGCRDHY